MIEKKTQSDGQLGPGNAGSGQANREDSREASGAIAVGSDVLHRPTGEVRRVSGLRAGSVHFAQVIKRADGSNFYWAPLRECRLWRPGV